jgi:peptidoglycan/LPS O-acetylase OafA/YrhL
MSRPVPLQSIQILRALAATLVVIGHAFHDSTYIAQHTSQPLIEMPYFEWGFGVDIFFVISGFIMIYTTVDLFGQPGAASTFLTRRLIRIAPLYWLTTALLILVAIFAPHFLNVPIESWRSVVTSYLFIPDVRGNGEVRPILATGWTLNYEMFFYAIFACALTLPLRRGLLWVVGFFIFLSVAGFMAALPGAALPFWTDSIILEFVLGILVGLLCLSKRSLSGRSASLLAAAAVLLAIALGPIWAVTRFCHASFRRAFPRLFWWRPQLWVRRCPQQAWSCASRRWEMLRTASISPIRSFSGRSAISGFGLMAARCR